MKIPRWFYLTVLVFSVLGAVIDFLMWLAGEPPRMVPLWHRGLESLFFAALWWLSVPVVNAAVDRDAR